MLPSFLKAGDKIAIISTARKVSPEEMQSAIETLKSWGFEIVLGKNLFKEENQYSGSDDERANDLQQMLDDESVKAILFARGGYGTVRIIDKIDFAKFKANPKWLIGFSDITVLHSHIHTHFGIATLHSPMAINFLKISDDILNRLKLILSGQPSELWTKNSELNKHGNAKGILVGGNLSLLYALNNTPSDIDTKNKILFIEDLDEYLYHIDRMMMNLKRSGKLSGLAGLIVGGMSDMKDNIIPFGKNAGEIISDAVTEYNFPVCFNFPAGHIENNHPFILGCEVELIVGENVSINFPDNPIT